MDFDKYSRQSLENHNPGSSELIELLQELDHNVAEILNEAVAAKLREVVTSLNAVGHQMVESNRAPAYISFCENKSGASLPLRLSCDIVISSGFGSTSDSDSNTRKVNNL